MVEDVVDGDQQCGRLARVSNVRFSRVEDALAARREDGEFSPLSGCLFSQRMQSPLYAQSPTIAVHLPSHPTAINAGSPCTPSSPNFAHLHHSTSTSTWTLPGEISLRPALALSPPSTVSSSGFALSPLNTGGGGAPSPLVEMNGTTTGGAGGATVGGGRLDYAALPSWQDPTVSLWLSAALPSLPTSSYALLFAQNDIRGSVLLEVDQSALKEMGVRSVGDRVKICVAVRALRGKYLAATGAGTGAGSVRGGVLGRVVAQGGMSRPGSPLVPSSPVNSPPSQYSAQFTSPPPSSSSNYAFASPPMTSSLPSTVSTMSSPQLSTISPASSSSIPSHHPPAAQAGFSLGHSRPGSYSARSLSTGNRIPPPLHLAQSNVHQYSASNLPSPAAPPPGGQQAAMLSASPPSRATSPRSAGLTPSRPIPPPSGPPPAGRAPLAPGNQQQNWLGDIPGLASTAPGGGMTTSVSTGSISSLRSNTLPYNALASSSSSSAASSSTTLVPGHRKASSSSLVSSPLHSRPSTAQSSYAGHPYASTPTQATALLPSPLDRFSRPTTAATISSTSSGSSLTPPSASSSSASPNNLDIMRRAVKFTSADGVTSRVLAVADAKDGREVLARVMKKFGGGQGEDVEGWGVYTQSEAGGGAFCFLPSLLPSLASAPSRMHDELIRSAFDAHSPTPHRARTLPNLPERFRSGASSWPRRPPSSTPPPPRLDLFLLDALRLPTYLLRFLPFAAFVPFGAVNFLPAYVRIAHEPLKKGEEAPVGLWRVARSERGADSSRRNRLRLQRRRRGRRSRERQPYEPELPRCRDSPDGNRARFAVVDESERRRNVCRSGCCSGGSSGGARSSAGAGTGRAGEDGEERRDEDEQGVDG